MTKIWGFKVPFMEHEVNTIYAPKNKYFEKQTIISVMEFLQDTKFPKEAVEDVNFWNALKHAIRPVFKGSYIVAVVCNVTEGLKV